VQGLARTPAAAPLLTRWSAAAGGEALLLAGRPEHAAARIGTPGEGLDYGSSSQRVILARVRMAQSEPAAAEELIRPLLRPGYPFREHTVAAYVLHTVIADGKYRDVPALKALAAAIELAEPDRIRRPFRLSVSVNTIKAHLRSMYRKLNVNNRREAVERARKLGLL